MRTRSPAYLGLAATLALGGAQALGANPPNTPDVPPSNVVPAPVDMMPAAPQKTPAETRPVTPSAPMAKPREPSGNPLWAIPLSTLIATRERPLFLPDRRAPALTVATAPAVPPPPPAQPAAAEHAGPPLVLVGAIASETEGFAVFVDQTTNTVIRLRTGQDHQGWVLRSVKGREATLEKDRASTTLVLPVPGIPAAMPAAAPAGAPRHPNGGPDL